MYCLFEGKKAPPSPRPSRISTLNRRKPGDFELVKSSSTVRTFSKDHDFSFIRKFVICADSASIDAVSSAALSEREKESLKRFVRLNSAVSRTNLTVIIDLACTPPSKRILAMILTGTVGTGCDVAMHARRGLPQKTLARMRTSTKIATTVFSKVV